MEFILMLIAATGVLWGSLLHDANAADIQRTNLSYLAGDGYVTGEHQRNVITLDTIKAGAYGVIYANVDLQSFNTAKYSSNISRVVGHLGNGLHLAGQIQNTQGYSNTNVGFGYDWFGKDGFAGVDVYRRADSLRGNGSYVFAFGRIMFFPSVSVGGFIDVSMPDAGQVTQWLAQPSIMYHFDDAFSIGIEQQLYLNKNYVKGLDESVPQIKLTYGF